MCTHHRHRHATTSHIRLPAEWEPQSGVQLTWPHPHTDWHPILSQAEACFAAIATHITHHCRLLVAAVDVGRAQKALRRCPSERIRYVDVLSDDSWARDHGGISVWDGQRPTVLDFQFNGWGRKYASELDNHITRTLFDQGAFTPSVQYRNHLDFVLEGGSIDSDGCGTLMTTRSCLLSPQRNPHCDAEQIEMHLRQRLGVDRILMLNDGHLEGDDTDGHIDTLARFCSRDTIAFVSCSDPRDSHYRTLRNMANELRDWRTNNHTPYRLLPLPMADAVYCDGMRLPATYANFLILNDAVLMPAYGTPTDGIAAEILTDAFPGREIISIDCQVLLKQHGSLHCVTMQYPAGVLEE